MKTIITLILLVSVLLMPVTSTNAAAGDLYIYVSLTKTERSRDSNSRTTNITVSGNKIVYQKVYRGYRRNPIEPINKEFTITDEQIKSLEKLVRDHNLLTSGSLEYPTTGGGFVYFEMSLEVKADGQESQIDISGPSKAEGIKAEKLYKNADALLEEIYRIINAQDDEISYSGDAVLVGAP